MTDGRSVDPAKVNQLLERDFAYYVSRVVKIQTKDGGIRPFLLNDSQKYLHQRLEAQKARQGYIRALLLKCRQWGGSTYTEARGYSLTSRRENQTGLVMAHRDDASTNLFRMIKRMKEYDEVYCPVTEQSNAKELVFRTPANSRYMVQTAGKTTASGVGRSFFYRFVHCSEVAWWGEMGAHTMGGLMEAVPSEHPGILGTEVIWETTANGYDSLFYSRWQETEEALKRGEPSEWDLIFIPWFWHTAYSLELDEDQRAYVMAHLSEEEKWLMRQKRHDGQYVSAGQVAWRRQKIQSSTPPPGLTKVQFFDQEYPATSISAFQSTGSHIFDLKTIALLIQEAPEPIKRYEFLPGSGQAVARDDGRLKVWKEPDGMRAYIIGADVAEGLEHGDYSCADVIDHHTGEVVAKWHGHEHPQVFGQILAALGRRYNTAWIGVERNNHGLTTLTALHDLDYKRLYVEEPVESPGALPRKRYGWVTTRKTKPMMVDVLVKLVDEEPEAVKDRETFEEMLRFERHEDGTYGAQEGYNDDRLISLAIARELRRLLPTPRQAAHQEFGRKRNAPRRNKDAASKWKAFAA